MWGKLGTGLLTLSFLYIFPPIPIILIMLIGSIIKPQLTSRVQLYYKSTHFTESIISKCPSLKGRFLPTCWLFNGMLHVMFEGTLGDIPGDSIFCPEVFYTKEQVFLPDGGLMSIDWANLPSSSSSISKILIIGPGITGNSDSQYVRVIVLEAIKKNYTVAVLHGRGIANNEILTFKVHCACAFDDYAYIIDYIYNKHPKASLVGVGTSMGAGILLKYAVLAGENCKLKALAAVATPFYHAHAAKNAENFWPYFGLPGKFILNILRRISKTFRPQLEKWPEELKRCGIDFSNIGESKSYYDFDDKFTAKISGFKGADEYYNEASSINQLYKVKIPVLALSSLDDPVISAEVIPYKEFCESDKLILMTTNNGGHVGWFTGNLMPKRWFQIPCVEYLEAVLTTQEN